MIKLVLLPGLDGTGRLFSDFASALAPDFEPVVVRYPADLSLGYAELETVAHSFLPADGKFVNVAESCSGPIAISISASNPPGLAGLVLCCTFARNPWPLLGLLKPLLYVIPFKSPILGPLTRLCLGNSSTTGTRSALREALGLVRPEILRARVKAVLAVDVSSKFSQIGVPIQYLQASRDRVLPLSVSKSMRGLSPNVRVQNLDGPHLLL